MTTLVKKTSVERKVVQGYTYGIARVHLPRQFLDRGHVWVLVTDQDLEKLLGDLKQLRDRLRNILYRIAVRGDRTLSGEDVKTLTELDEKLSKLLE